MIKVILRVIVLVGLVSALPALYSDGPMPSRDLYASGGYCDVLEPEYGTCDMVSINWDCVWCDVAQNCHGSYYAWCNCTEGGMMSVTGGARCGECLEGCSGPEPE